MDKLEIDISKLIKFSLSLEQFLITDCVYRNRQNLLEQWVTKFGSFDKESFNQLIEKGYLFPINEQITYDVLKLTPKYYNDFELETNLNHEKYFAELQEIFPRKVKGRSALQTNLSNCRKKYKEICTSEEKHKLVLECLKLYINDLTKTGKLEFIQSLPTWLNQKSYEGYIDEVEKGITGDEKPSYDAI